MNKQPITRFISMLGVILTLVMTGCASTEYVENERDPWQGFNRTVYGFNDTLDQALLKPALSSRK